MRTQKITIHAGLLMFHNKINICTMALSYAENMRQLSPQLQHGAGWVTQVFTAHSKTTWIQSISDLTLDLLHSYLIREGNSLLACPRKREC